MKSLISVTAAIAVLLLAGSVAFGQQSCVPQTCPKQAQCLQDLPSKCTGSLCPPAYRCYSTPGRCSTDSEHFCWSRYCTTTGCPINTDGVERETISVGTRLVTYEGMKDFPVPAFDAETWKNYSDPQFLLAHPKFVRMDKLLGYEVYVLSDKMPGGVGYWERWFAPSAGTGPMIVKFVVSGTGPDQEDREITAVSIQ